MNFIKIFSTLVVALFVFIIVDACKPNTWSAHIYTEGVYQGVDTLFINGFGGYKGEVLFDTLVDNNGNILVAERYVLIERVKL